MNSSYIHISGGTVYDPANGDDGVVKDVWVWDGKIADPLAGDANAPVRPIDATGLVVMPGGIDMHCHIAGPKVNAARKMRPEEKRAAPAVARTATTRSGTLGSVPSTYAAAYKYAALGYTTAFDAAVAPMAARHVHEEFADFPCLDKGFFTLVGNNHYALRCINGGEHEQLDHFLGWLFDRSKAYALKLVNPGGVVAWKDQRAGNVSGIDDHVAHFDLTPRQIIQGLAAAADRLATPHPIHLHCNNLGMPGNWQTTLATMQALEGQRGHLTHIQFHSYGGGEAEETSFSSRSSGLIEYFNSHENLSVDVGQVLFGPTTSMTGDGPVGHYLSRLSGQKWFSKDIENEAGCGIVPIAYKNKNLVHAIQWAAGLEWFLLAGDLWRIALSTDQPNGASFLAYPQLIHLLMDAAYRRELIGRAPATLKKRTVLADLDREFSLQEICIVTRAAPARILGLTHKGHLGVGADADITIYSPSDNKREMFELPRWVIKAGEVLVEGGEIRSTPMGRTHHAIVDYDRSVAAANTPLADWFENQYSVKFENYGMRPEEVPDAIGQKRVYQP